MIKTQIFQKMFWYVTVCRAFLADHYGKKNFLISSTNNAVKGKILKKSEVVRAI